MANEVHFPDGFFGDYPGGAGAAPGTPTLTLSVSGTTVTATIDGDAGVTNYLVYKVASDSAWTAGGDRVGDGDLVVAGLSTGVRYSFVAFSLNGTIYSPPSLVQEVLIETSTISAQDAMLAVAADQLLSQFGEAVTYYPKGGGTRDIVGVVDRNPVGAITGSPHGNTPRMMVIVKNDASDGISSSEVNTGGDKINLDVRIGESEQQRRITSLVWHDYGMMHLEVA